MSDSTSSGNESARLAFPQPMTVTVGGELLVLLPELAIWWPRTRTVLLTDTHFGKTATFRSHGIPIGDETLARDLERLSRLVKSTRAERLIHLGDLLHSRHGLTAATVDRLMDWRAAHRELAIELIAGNHDRASGRLPADFAMSTHSPLLREGDLVFSHFPREVDDAFVLAGHLHPKFSPGSRFDRGLKLPCFWLQRGVLILPAFGSFIDSARIDPRPGERVFVPADGAVHEVTRVAERGPRN